MARPVQVEITLRLRIGTPVTGVWHSLQDKSGAPVNAQRADGAELVFDVLVRADERPRFFGPHVRNEGPARQFFYIGVGKHAGDPGSTWDRRMKVDIHAITAQQVSAAAEGGLLEATVNGTGPDGSPACATVKPVSGWTWRA